MVSGNRKVPNPLPISFTCIVGQWQNSLQPLSIRWWNEEQGSGLPPGLSASMEVKRIVHIASLEHARMNPCKGTESPKDRNQRRGIDSQCKSINHFLLLIPYSHFINYHYFLSFLHCTRKGRWSTMLTIMSLHLLSFWLVNTEITWYTATRIKLIF